MKYYFAIFLHFRPQLKIFLALTLFFILTGCANYKYCNEKFLVQPKPAEDKASTKEYIAYQKEKKAASHWLYKVIPRHRSQIYWYDLPHWFTWMCFGNDDDGLFGESFKHPYKLDVKNDTKKAMQWWLRNPLHNFCFYAIGSAQRENSEFTVLNFNTHGVYSGQYSTAGSRNFGCDCTSLFIALHGGKPFMSVRVCYPWNRKTEFYIGWRERGNFGMKFLPMFNESKHVECFIPNETSENLGVLDGQSTS